MKNTYPGSNALLNITSLTKFSILIFLITVIAVTTATAQCGFGAAVQSPGALTAIDPTWATVTKNIIGSNPNNTVTNNSGNVFPIASSDGSPVLAGPTSRQADFGSPTWQAQWTTSALYILVTVPDLTVNFDPIPNDPFFYNYDAVEVYLSGNNAHAGAPYGPDDVQYGFSNGVYRGIGSGTGTGSSTIGVTGTTIVTPGVGYTMFITIPLASFTAPTTMNSQVSFDIAIDDNDHLANIATKMAADSATLTHAPYNYPPTGPASAQLISQGFRSGGDYRDAQVAWNSTTGQAPYSTTSDLANLKLTAPPTPATAHNQSICGSGIITLAGNAPTVGTGQWTATGGLANLSDLHNPADVNNPTGTFFSAGIGTYVFTWSILNSACSAIPSTANDSISVTPLPLLFTTAPAAVCSPATVDITDPSVTAGSTAGTVITYFTDPSTMISLTTPTAVATSGTYYVKSTSTSNCITVTPVTVTINISPIITITKSNPTACLSSTGSFTVNGLTPGASFTIAFDKGGIPQTPQTFTASPGGTVTVSGLPAGTYTNIIAMPAAGCVSNAGSATLTDPAAPTPTASTGGIVCAGGTLTLNSTLTAGASYTWTGPNGFTGSGSTIPIPGATSLDSGLYTVTVTVANCVGTSSVVGVVNPTPVLVITNPTAICAPSGIDITLPTVTAGSTLPSGTVLTYYTNAGATTVLTTPTNVTTSGTYYIKATSGLGCINVKPVIVTINPQPAITVTKTNPTACATSTGTFIVGGLTPGAAYTINFDKGGVAQTPQTLTASGAGTVTVTGLPAGSYTNITATSAAGCTSNTGNATLNDPAAPTPTASTGGIVCAGGTLTLNSTLTAGASYTWTGPNGFTGSGSTVTIPGATSLDSGLYTVTVTLASCVGTSSVVGVVNPTPVLVITNPTAICAPSGIDITLPAVTAGSTLPPGTVLTYYTNAGATTVLTTPTNVTGSGTYYIKATSGLGCIDIKSVTVTINPQPAITVTKTNPTICATNTGTFIISGLTPGAIYTINFDKGGVAQAPQTITASGAGTVTVTGLSAGSYTNITATSAAGCTSNTGNATLNDPAAPTPTATTGGTICTGNSLILNSTLTGGATYTWTGPNGYTATGASQTIPGATSLDSGLYTVTVTLAGCVGTSSVIGVVNPTPVLVVNTPLAICAPSGVDITLPAVTTGSTLPPGTVITYYTNAGATTVLTTPTNVTTSGTYYIKATSGLGCVDIKPVVVTVNPQPAITVTKTNPTICATNTGTFIIGGLTPGAIYTINFDKGGVPQTPQTLTASGTGTVTVTGLSAGSYTNITATSAAGCTSNTGNATLNDPAAPTPTASTGGIICVGNTLTLNSTLTAGASYTWTGPNGYTAIGATQTIPGATSLDSGLYTVTVTLAGCVGTSSIVSVVNPTPVLMITNPTAICAPSGIDITLPAVTAGSTLPPGSVLTYYTNAGATTVLTTPTNITTSGTYYIKASTGTGCNDIKPVVVIINPKPAITITSTNPVACATNTGSFILNGLTPGDVYIINFDKGGIAQAPQTITASGAGTVTVTGLTAGSYTNITATSAAGCASNAGTATLNDPAAPTPTASTGGPVCSGNTLTLASTVTAGATYTWTGPNGYSATGPTQSILNAPSLDSGLYTVTVMLTGCIGTSSVAGVVNTTPVLTITNPTVICSFVSIDITAPAITAGSILPAGTVLSYYTNAAATAPLAAPAAVTTGGTYYIKAVSTAGCTDVKPVVVMISALPPITITATDPTSCSTNTGSFTVNGLNPGTVYTINFDKGGVAQTAQTFTAPAAGTITINGLSAGSYTNIIASVAAGCVSNTGSATLSDPTSPTPVASTGGPVCAGNTLTLASTITAGATYTWTGPNGYSTSGPTQNRLSTVIADSGLYTVTVTVSGCTGTSSVVGVVNPTPILTITNPTAICAPGSIDITLPAITAGSTLPSGSVLSYYNDATATIALAAPTSITTSGTYYIKALTGSGCSDIEPVTVTINPLPVLTITDPAQVCFPATVDITVPAITTGSTTGTTLSYYTDAPATTSLSTATGVATSGTYYIKAITASGCSVIQPVTVTINPLPLLTITDPAQVCFPATVDITLPAVTTGSSAGITLGYFTDATATTTLTTSSAVATSGTYYIKATTPSGCSVIEPVTVIINPLPVLTITDPAQVCFPATVDITLPAVTTGSSAGTTLGYYTDGTATTSFTTSSAVTTSGTYYIKATTASGCSVIQPVTVTINPLPVLLITDPAAVCSPATVDITSPAITAGSTTGTTFNYYTDGAATTILPAATAVTTGGTYYIQSTTAASCSVIKPVHVIINPSPVLIITDPAAVCSPGTVNIAAAAVTAGSTTGTTLGYYTDMAATTIFGSPETISASNTYYIKAMALSGCSTIAPVVATINISPLPPGVAPLKYCQGDNIPALTAVADAGNTLLWYQMASGGAATTTAFIPSNENNSIYFVSQKDANGCESNTRAEIDVKITVLPRVTVNPDVIEKYGENGTNGEEITLTGTATGFSEGATTVTWNNIEAGVLTPIATTEQTNTTAPSANIPLDSTRYYFIGTSVENSNCADTASVLVRILQPIMIPNIFSPNGDGINDVWDIKNIQEFDNAEVSIFNRYGQFIYKSSDGYKTPWDGTYHGDPVPVGTYFYIIKTPLNKDPISGYVAVVR
jgi:gliding motility-associated-like protein